MFNVSELQGIDGNWLDLYLLCQFLSNNGVATSEFGKSQLMLLNLTLPVIVVQAH